MIQLKDIININQILVNTAITSKKRAIEALSQVIVANHKELDEQQVFDHFIERERLGSTGFGNGVAIPHCRIPNCQEPIVAILKLPAAIDFSAIDEKPVDILIALVVAEQATEDHLQLLKQIAELLSKTELCEKLRKATTSEEIYQLMVNNMENNS